MITAGNNQSGILGSTLANATLALADTAGAVPAPLDVSALNHLTGATGSAVVASGGTGTYTSTEPSGAPRRRAWARLCWSAWMRVTSSRSPGPMR